MFGSTTIQEEKKRVGNVHGYILEIEDKDGLRKFIYCAVTANALSKILKNLRSSLYGVSKIVRTVEAI